MAIDRIAEKLSAYLKKDIPINSEAEALYFLVEIGKILERDQNIKFPLIKFYRDWACHPRKDRKIQEVLDIVQNIYKDAKNHMQSPYGLGKPVAILDFTNGDHLNKQMKMFLAEYGLLGDNLLSDKNWKWFASMLCNVLAEQPLYLKSEGVEYIEFLPVVQGAVGVKVVFTSIERGWDGKEYGYYQFLNYLGSPSDDS